MESLNTVAVVLASGSGERFGKTKTPKHLTKFLGVPSLIWTVNTIISSQLFSAVVVVVSKINLHVTKESLGEYFNNLTIPVITAEGAEDRTQSFDLGLKCLNDHNYVDKSSIVALFDANRPFVETSQLSELHQAMSTHACACPARPLVNGVAVVEAGYICSVPKKSDLVEFVTPEFLRLDKYECNLENFLDGHSCFVELSLSFNLRPFTIPASDINTKLTYPEDQAFMEALAKQKKLEPPKVIK